MKGEWGGGIERKHKITFSIFDPNNVSRSSFSVWPALPFNHLSL